MINLKYDNSEMWIGARKCVCSKWVTKVRVKAIVCVLLPGEWCCHKDSIIALHAVRIRHLRHAGWHGNLCVICIYTGKFQGPSEMLYVQQLYIYFQIFCFILFLFQCPCITTWDNDRFESYRIHFLSLSKLAICI